uniref:Putative secreted peptide n=1 Tax=Anopheles braziliensis TaxID=58242 RepID=A0A2M3ZMS8_9DIPT
MFFCSFLSVVLSSFRMSFFCMTKWLFYCIVDDDRKAASYCVVVGCRSVVFVGVKVVGRSSVNVLQWEIEKPTGETFCRGRVSASALPDRKLSRQAVPIPSVIEFVIHFFLTMNIYYKL